MTSKDQLEARVNAIIHMLDWSRIGEVGGYETEWTIEHGKVYWATLDAGKEYNRTALVVMPVEQFLTAYEWAEDGDRVCFCTLGDCPVRTRNRKEGS